MNCPVCFILVIFVGMIEVVGFLSSSMQFFDYIVFLC